MPRLVDLPSKKAIMTVHQSGHSKPFMQQQKRLQIQVMMLPPELHPDLSQAATLLWLPGASARRHWSHLSQTDSQALWERTLRLVWRWTLNSSILMPATSGQGQRITQPSCANH